MSAYLYFNEVGKSRFFHFTLPVFMGLDTPEPVRRTNEQGKGASRRFIIP